MRVFAGPFRVLAHTAGAVALVAGARVIGAQAATRSHDEFTYQSGWPASCSTGVQSPVTFVGASPTRQSYSVVISASAPQATVGAHAHTADFVFPRTGGGSVAVGPSNYTLESFHFHFPIEHQLPRTGGPGAAPATFELHVKSKDARGQYAVFGVQFVAADSGSRLDDRFFSAVVRGISLLGTGRSLPIPIVDALATFTTMPFYSYVGSTTSPNCDPAVTWYVLSAPIPVKSSVVERFRAALKAQKLDAANARLMTYAGPPQSGVAIIEPKP